jgi:hypothetical protein
VSVAALITWLITAGGGLFLLAIWLIEYDRDFQTAAATRLPVPVISAHALLAVGGLGVWSAYLVVDDDRLAWTAVAILGVVAALGLTMAARWLKVYRATASRVPVPAGAPAPLTPPATVPPERHFPVPVVIAHGALAVTTLVLVLLTALRATS